MIEGRKQHVRKDPKERKRELLETGARLAAKVGLTNVSRKALADKCKVTGGLVSRYWPNIDDMYKDIKREATKQGLSLPDADKTEKLRAKLYHDARSGAPTAAPAKTSSSKSARKKSAKRSVHADKADATGAVKTAPIKKSVTSSSAGSVVISMTKDGIAPARSVTNKKVTSAKKSSASTSASTADMPAGMKKAAAQTAAPKTGNTSGSKGNVKPKAAAEKPKRPAKPVKSTSASPAGLPPLPPAAPPLPPLPPAIGNDSEDSGSSGFDFV